VTGNATSIVCAGCGFVMSPDEPYPFRCPNARPSDDIDHVLVRELDPTHVGFPQGDEANPYVRYRELFHAYHLGLGHGITDGGFVDLVESLDKAVAEVDGRRRNGRIRLAAPLGTAQLDEVAGHQVDEHARMVWDSERDDLVARVERRLGRLRLGVVERRPPAGTATITALVDRVRSTNLAALSWTDAARSLQARVGFLRAVLGDPWPDVSDAALRRHLDDWLTPVLTTAGATGRTDLERVDLVRVLRAMVPAEVAGDLDRLAPPAATVPSGRRVSLDYGGGAAPGDPPVLAGGRVAAVPQDGHRIDRAVMEAKHLLGRIAGQRPSDGRTVEARRNRAGAVRRDRNRAHRPAMTAQLRLRGANADRQDA